MCWLYDMNRFEFLGCAIGIPIAPNSSLVTRNIAQKLPDDFALMSGFDEEELRHHTYSGVNEFDDLFIRQPGYALFCDKNTGKKILVCSVHLNSDPTKELAYTGELLHSNPDLLLKNHNIVSILCGDLNLTACKLPERQELPIHGRNEDKWKFGLSPPFSRHVTNLGSAFSVSSSSTPNQCYDNFIVPSFVRHQPFTHAAVLSLPPGFIDFLNLKQIEHARDVSEVRSTRSRKDLVRYVAQNYFSDHLPIVLEFLL